MGQSDDTISREKANEEIRKMKDHFYDPEDQLEKLFEQIGNSRIVLLGEASHGTHEYYTWRARISKELIRNKGFNMICVEGDWPDCYRINRYIRSYTEDDVSALQVLKEFHRWPTWMWANWEIAALMDWLKNHNKGKDFRGQAGFYGLDVYSLWESLEAIFDYLEKNDPAALPVAERAIQCFEPYDREGQDYATAARLTPESCEPAVLRLLMELRERVPMYNSDPEAPFNTEQNAHTAVNAERYYRSMIKGGPESWNIRDTHMTDTLERLLDFYGSDSKAIVWEHNTHIGDARATDMHRHGMVNVGQLARERWKDQAVFSVGFGSYRGTVIAGESWGAPMEEMEVPAARKDSWEELLHREGPEDKVIICREIKDYELMSKRLSHRAIGVVYDPTMERYGNYVPSLIPARYDAFMFIDETKALHPIYTSKEENLVPETYPFGL